MNTFPRHEPLTALAVAAVQMHELFVEYQRAGFTASQALQLLCVTLQASVTEGTKNQGGPA